MRSIIRPPISTTATPSTTRNTTRARAAPDWPLSHRSGFRPHTSRTRSAAPRVMASLRSPHDVAAMRGPPLWPSSRSPPAWRRVTKPLAASRSTPRRNSQSRSRRTPNVAPTMTAVSARTIAASRGCRFATHAVHARSRWMIAPPADADETAKRNTSRNAAHPGKRHRRARVPERRPGGGSGFAKRRRLRQVAWVVLFAAPPRSRVPYARGALAIGLAVVLGAATAVSAQDPPPSADVPTDPVAERLQHLSDFATRALGPQDRQMLEALKAAMQADRKPASDSAGARFGWSSTGKPSEGGYDVAETLLRASLDADESTLGPNHPGTATGLDRLARKMVSEGRYAEAEPLLRRALKIDETALPRSPHTADILGDLGGLLVATDRSPEAEPLLRRALAIDEAVLGPASAAAADTLNALTNALESQGRTAGAETDARRALSIDEQALGAEAAGVADDLDSLAGLLLEQGRYADAEPLLKRALTIDARLLGPAHPNTADVEEGLAVAEFGLGRFEPAVRLLRPACKVLAAGVVSRGAHGDTHIQSKDQAASCARTLSQFLWAWSARGGGHEASDRPDALAREGFEAAQVALDSRAGDALARYGARAAAAAAGVGQQADAYEAALLDRDRLDVEIAKAAGDAQGGARPEDLDKARDEVAARIDRLGATLRSLAGRYWDYRAAEP